MSDDLDLGPCCCCGGTESVRTIVMLNRRAPVADTGWGCFVCGLSFDGAMYVACDHCARINAPAREVVVGFPAKRGRMPIQSLLFEPFEHRMEFHEEG